MLAYLTDIFGRDNASASVYDGTLEIDWFVHLRRRAATAAVTACGHLGHVAVLADDADTVVQAYRVVAPWLADGVEEPGATTPRPSPAGRAAAGTPRPAPPAPSAGSWTSPRSRSWKRL